MPSSSSTIAPSGSDKPLGKLQATFAPGQKVTIFGHSGTGKTVLARKLLGGIPRRCPIVVLDPKNHVEADGPEWEIVRELPDLWERHVASEKHPKYLRLIVRPFPEEGSYPGSKVRYQPLNDLYHRIWLKSYSPESGRQPLPHELVTVYLDDLQEVTDEHRASAELRRLWNMGRARKLSVWLSTLRPAKVPREAFAEADHLFKFWIRDDEDKKRAKELMGTDLVMSDPGPGPYDFWYLPPGVASAPIAIQQGHGDKVWGA